MNGIKGKLWAKLAAMFIFVVSAVVFGGSLVAVVFMAESDIFFDNGRSLNESVLNSCLANKMTDVIYTRVDYQPFYTKNNIEEEDSTEGVNDASEDTIHSHEAVTNNVVDNADTESQDINHRFSRKDIKDYAEYLDRVYSKDNSNLYIEIYNSENELIYSSSKNMPENSISRKSTPVAITVLGEATPIYAQFADMSTLEAYLYDLDDKGDIFNSNITAVPLDGYVDESETPELCSYILEAEFYETKTETITYSLYIPKTLIVKDDIYVRCEKISMLVEYKYIIVAVMCVSALMVIISFIFVICSAGYSNRFEGLHLSLFDKLPLEIYFGVALLALMFLMWLAEEIGYTPFDAVWIGMVVFEVIVAAVAAVFIILMLTISARCKAGKLFHYTFIFGSIILAFRLLKYIFSNMKYIWRVVLVIGATVFYELILLAMIFSGNDAGVFIWMLSKVVLIAVAIIYAIGMGKIKEGCKKISSGNSNAKVDSSGMPGDLKSLALDINSIGNGIQLAVDERTKSERLKAELITNVSHDLKTPLTSIVNYVDILSKQDIQPDTAKEHVEILVRQSQRMKKLIDDLVEASKASAGAISVNPQRLDMSLLLTQAMTEYEEKLAKSDITPILSFPKVPATVMVDGRLMWRVLDNLIGNICKYAQPQTRVYASVSCSDKSVFVVFKNVSKYALNISSEELMERFVRGDSSRHTEGSGLGLSIAKSLCELQNVGFDITIDGDLFKAQLTLTRLPDTPVQTEPAPQAQTAEYPTVSSPAPVSASVPSPAPTPMPVPNPALTATPTPAPTSAQTPSTQYVQPQLQPLPPQDSSVVAQALPANDLQQTANEALPAQTEVITAAEDVPGVDSAKLDNADGNSGN